jgi:hypothetical protein
MLSKKVLISILTIGMLATVASTGTWAYFLDSATTADDTVNTGSLLLSLTNGATSGKISDVTFLANNAKPGDTDVLVKLIRVANVGSLDGQLIATTVNVRDPNGLGQFLTIKVDGQTVFDHGKIVEGVVTNNLESQNYITPKITYSFEDAGDQNNVQRSTFTFDLVFTLQSLNT